MVTLESTMLTETQQNRQQQEKLWGLESKTGMASKGEGMDRETASWKQHEHEQQPENWPLGTVSKVALDKGQVLLD